MKRIISLCLIISFISTSVIAPQRSYASTPLPEPGTMVNLSSTYTPVLIKGLKVHPENPLLFDFILDTGHSGLSVQIPASSAGASPLQLESQKLIKYFLAALTIPEADLWVNLSPYEKDRIVPEELGKTELGRDMLAQDYILKQLTASLIYPEKQLGKEFWSRIYAKAQQLYGDKEVPVNTFNKVWIMADKAKILERNNTAYVVGSHLKVMLEEDYLAMNKNAVRAQDSNQIVRDLILPEIEKEVNEGKNFAPLRQIFHSMILASWYKLALKDALLNQVYSNKAKTGGVLSDDVKDKEKIYEQYLKAYKKGVFNYIKEDMDAVSKQPIARKYFSGGEKFFEIAPDRLIQRVQSLQAGESTEAVGDLAIATVAVDRAMSIKYPTPESVVAKLAERDKAGLPNNASFLIHETIENGGDQTLYKAAQDFEIPLPTTKLYPTQRSTSRELERRLIDSVPNNSGILVNKRKSEGGDLTLYRAMRRWKVSNHLKISKWNVGKVKGETYDLPESVGYRFARRMAEIVKINNHLKKKTVVILPTGGTQEEFYRLFVEIVKAEQIDLSNLITINMDEYYVGPEAEQWDKNSQSYRQYMETHLFSKLRKLDLGWKEENAHLLNGNATDIEAEVERYEKVIRDAGGVELAYGGIGTDRHIAFNEPIIVINGAEAGNIENLRGFNEFYVKGGVEKVKQVLQRHAQLREEVELIRFLTEKFVAANNPQIPEAIERLTRKIRKQKTVIYLDAQDYQNLQVFRDAVGSLGLNPNDVKFENAQEIARSRTRHVYLAIQTIIDNGRYFKDDVSLMPVEALSVGIGTIMDAQEVMIAATGDKKAEAVYQSVTGSISPESSASYLQAHSNVTYVVDAKAAEKFSDAAMNASAPDSPQLLAFKDFIDYVQWMISTNFEEYKEGQTQVNFRKAFDRDPSKETVQMIDEVEGLADEATPERFNQVINAILERNKKLLEPDPTIYDEREALYHFYMFLIAVKSGWPLNSQSMRLEEKNSFQLPVEDYYSSIFYWAWRVDILRRQIQIGTKNFVKENMISAGERFIQKKRRDIFDQDRDRIVKGFSVKDEDELFYFNGFLIEMRQGRFDDQLPLDDDQYLKNNPQVVFSSLFDEWKMRVIEEEKQYGPTTNAQRVIIAQQIILAHRKADFPKEESERKESLRVLNSNVREFVERDDFKGAEDLIIRFKEQNPLLYMDEEDVLLELNVHLESKQRRLLKKLEIDFESLKAAGRYKEAWRLVRIFERSHPWVLEGSDPRFLSRLLDQISKDQIKEQIAKEQEALKIGIEKYKYKILVDLNTRLDLGIEAKDLEVSNSVLGLEINITNLVRAGSSQEERSDGDGVSLIDHDQFIKVRTALNETLKAFLKARFPDMLFGFGFTGEFFSNRVSSEISLNASDAAMVEFKRVDDTAEREDPAQVAAKGGIDLNAKNMGLDITKDAQGVAVKFPARGWSAFGGNPAMVAEFQKGDFSGVIPVILRITPLNSVLPILGLEDTRSFEQVAKI